jgi:hypothetical protein
LNQHSKSPPRPALRPISAADPAKTPPRRSIAALRDEARDTLAPSSFGNVSARPSAAPAGMLRARAPLPTLGELESATATATLRPPGAVPPPPRSLPSAAASPEPLPFERAARVDTPIPLSRHALAPSPELESTVDMSATASRKAALVALVERTRAPESAPPPSAVPAPGLYIADEPLEPRPKQVSLATLPRQELSRLRTGMAVLVGLLLMAAGALSVLIYRRAEANDRRAALAAEASRAAAKPLPGCALRATPSRLSTVERSVPITVTALPDGNVAVGFAETKTAAAVFRYRALTGDAERLQSQAGADEVTHVLPSESPVVSRASADFSFGQSLKTGLTLGVGPNGLARRGADGATGVVWPLASGARVTPPRVAALPGGYFVALRRGGAEGQVVAGWLREDGSALTELGVVEGLPRLVGTPTVASLGDRAVLLVSARADKAAPYEVYAALAPFGHAPDAPRALNAPAEGGGAIAPSLTALSDGRLILQWTDGNVGQYQVKARLLDGSLAPLAAPLQLSAKGANAGQGSVTATEGGAVSLFIQTTAGHDELWGVALSCR